MKIKVYFFIMAKIKKNIYKTFLCFLLFLFACNKAIDPCDVQCDNCSTPKLCIECYEQCYESN